MKFIFNASLFVLMAKGMGHGAWGLGLGAWGIERFLTSFEMRNHTNYIASILTATRVTLAAVLE